MEKRAKEATSTTTTMTTACSVHWSLCPLHLHYLFNDSALFSFGILIYKSKSFHLELASLVQFEFAFLFVRSLTRLNLSARCVIALKREIYFTCHFTECHFVA